MRVRKREREREREREGSRQRERDSQPDRQIEDGARERDVLRNIPVLSLFRVRRSHATMFTC